MGWRPSLQFWFRSYHTTFMSGHSKNETKEKFQSERVDHAHVLNWNWWKRSIALRKKIKGEIRVEDIDVSTALHSHVETSTLLSTVWEWKPCILFCSGSCHTQVHTDHRIFSWIVGSNPHHFTETNAKIIFYFISRLFVQDQPSTWNVNVSTSNGKVLFSNQ